MKHHHHWKSIVFQDHCMKVMTKSSIKSISMDLEIHTSYMYLMENISAASASSGLWLKRGQKWRGRLKTSPGTKTAKFSNLSSGCFICYKFSAQICSTLSLLCIVARIKLTKMKLVFGLQHSMGISGLYLSEIQPQHKKNFLFTAPFHFNC